MAPWHPYLIITAAALTTWQGTLTGPTAQINLPAPAFPVCYGKRPVPAIPAAYRVSPEAGPLPSDRR